MQRALCQKQSSDSLYCFRQDWFTENISHVFTFLPVTVIIIVKGMGCNIKLFSCQVTEGWCVSIYTVLAPVYIYQKRKQQFVFFIWWQTRARAIRDFCLYICRQRQVYRKQFLFCTTSLKVLSYFNNLNRTGIRICLNSG